MLKLKKGREMEDECELRKRREPGKKWSFYNFLGTYNIHSNL